MAEKDIVLALAKKHKLIGVGDTEADRIENAAKFTRAAGYELRALGWGGLRKTSGLRVRDLSVDKLINRVSGEVADIVIASESPDARAAWQIVDRLDPSKYVEPEPEPGINDEPSPKPKPPMEPPDVTDVTERVGEFFDRIEDMLVSIDKNSDRIASALERIADEGVKLSVRF